MHIPTLVGIVLLLPQGATNASSFTPQSVELDSVSAREEPLALPTPSGTIHGTLLLPAEAEVGRPYPVALIIAGSGPTDRDGNNPYAGANNALRMLAEGLASQGVASLRFDKRGVGESQAAMVAEDSLRFETYVSDAAAWVRLLRRDPRLASVAIVGHSEGSLVGMLAARDAHADAFVSIAGAGRVASDLLRDQLRLQLPAPLAAEADRIITNLEAGVQPDSIPPVLQSLFRPSVQPYLISWFRYDPVVEFGRFNAPALVVQGTTDIQVSVGDAERLAEGNPEAELALIDGMNHVLKMVPPDSALQLASYGDPALPISAELVERVAAFLVGLDQ